MQRISRDRSRSSAPAPAGARVVHCPMRGPYDAGELDGVDDWLFILGDPALSIDALVSVLAGGTSPTAGMPVQIPGLDA